MDVYDGYNFVLNLIENCFLFNMQFHNCFCSQFDLQYAVPKANVSPETDNRRQILLI